MKITMYLDAYAGMTPEDAVLFVNPGKKMKESRRFRIDFEIPDFYAPDEIIDNVIVTESE